jgi:tripeptide aminopeptidase
MAKTATRKPRSKTSPPKAASQPGSRPAVPPITLDRKRAVALVLELMAIPGASGNEGAVARFITEKLVTAGLPSESIRHDNAHKKALIAGEVGNLIVQLPGTMRGPRRLLMAHMDTVPICVGSKPKRSGNLVRSADPNTGLGADDRAGVAVLLAAALEILENKLPHPPLTFLWAIQEEVGLQGARCVQTSLLGKPKLAFNFDGGAAEKLTIGATGGFRMEIDIEGLAAHAGGAPERGISAIAIASLAIARLVRDGWHGLIQKKEGQGTSNVGVIQGGAATNVVTDRVMLKAEARSHNPAFRKQIVKQIETAFREASCEVTNTDGKHGKVRIEGRNDYEAFRLPDDDPSLLAAEQAVRSSGLEPIRAISNGGLDANWMTAHGIPTVTLGCGQMNIHTTSECLDVAAFEHACQIGLRLATNCE